MSTEVLDNWRWKHHCYFCELTRDPIVQKQNLACCLLKRRLHQPSVAISHLLFWVITSSFCLLSSICCHLTLNDTSSSASHPNTSCDGIARDVAWTVSSWLSNMLLAHQTSQTQDQGHVCPSFAMWIMLASVLWHRSITEFACWFLLTTILWCVRHSLLSKSAASSSNSLPLLMTISVGHGKQASQLISKWLAMWSARLCMILQHSKNHVAGSVIVKKCSWTKVPFSGFFFSFTPKSHGTIRSMHRVCQGMISGVGFGGRSWHFLEFFLNSLQLLLANQITRFSPSPTLNLIHARDLQSATSTSGY